MERKLHEPLTLPEHPELLKKINETIIGITLHHIDTPQVGDRKEYEKAQRSHHVPTWDEIRTLLRDSYAAINLQRKDPRRY